MRRLHFLIALLLVSAAAGRIARAADPAPEEDKRPMSALAACASGDTGKGVSILGQLYAESLNPAYVFNQGRCYQKNGQLENARVRFEEYLRIGSHEPPQDIARAEGLIKEIDEALERQRANTPAPVLVAPVQPAREGRVHSLRVTSIVLAAVGAVAIGAGVYLSLKVRAMNDEINAEFANQDYVTDGAKLQQQLADGTRYETWQWVGYGVGVAALAGSVTTFVLSGFAGASPAAAEKTAAVDVSPLLSPSGMGGVLRMRF